MIQKFLRRGGLFLIIILAIFIASGCKKNKDKDDDPGNNPVVNEENPQSISVNISSDEVFIGEEITFSASIAPAKASQEITYSITDESVFSLNGNKLTALSAGEAYLIATSKKDPSITTSVQVKALHPLLETEDYTIKGVIGAPGEDASTMFNIHYNIKNTKSYALVTLADDESFTNATKYYGDGYYFEDMDELLDGPFEARNVWQIVADNLLPNTSYIYKVNAGNDTYSDVYHFKTAGGSETSFFLLADNHYYTGTDGSDNSAAVSELTISKALEINPNISFIMSAGDNIDTGGNDLIWDKWFTYAKSLKTLPYIGVPGNHEYYINGTGQRTNAYFACYSAGPLNGPGKLVGSSCYFMYNDILFIMVDNIKNTSYDEQVDWMCDLLENKDYKYSIVCFHEPVHYNNSDRDEVFLDVFQKYSVDLVIAGHYHSNNFQQYIYDGSSSTDPHLGVSYLTCYGAGVKAISSGADPKDFARGYIVKVNDDGININAINANGKSLNVYNISSRKNAPIVHATKDELMDSITCKNTFEDTENPNSANLVTFIWDSKCYGNVKKIIINEVNQNKLSNYSVCPTPAYTNMVFKDVYNGYEYKFVVDVIFNDDTHETKTFVVDRHKAINIKANEVTKTMALLSFDAQDAEFDYIINKYNIYVNGELVDQIDYLGTGGPVKRYIVKNLDASTEYTITFEAIDSNNTYLYSDQISFKTPS